MDDTNCNALLDATASRKRRSSILKSQRPPRTPLTELELNVATPTDTTKSRRVSFSRRTGVAEFITDEATNTWKTIYVEQNKSMESSINDSERNPPRQTVGHLGKRVFEQQFQEEEFVNFGSTLMTSNNAIAQELNMSLKGNLTQQFAALERDLDDKNLAAPQSNFELSSLTDHKSKIFGDDVTNPILGEMSNKINIDFSSFEPVGASQDKCYDLDEIEKDLLIPRWNAGNRPFGTMTNVSGQIEIDLNVKPAEVRSDELDMSITDTIQNPQVEEVSQSYKSTKNNRKSDMDIDWTLDKENIAINPYVAPKESINFAINEVPDQVLVFDGRRLTVQCEHKNTFDQIREKEDFNKTFLPDDVSDRPPQRKTIVLNLNDDLPNFIDVPAASGVPSLQPVGNNISTSKESLQRSTINNEFELSSLNVITKKTELLPNSHKTIIYDSGDLANISVTQAIITNILLEKEKRKTIVFENETGDLSMTQALPTNVVTASKSIPQNKTVLYDVDNISITQAVPKNLLLHNKITTKQTSIEPSQNGFDLSLTQAVPHNVVISNKTSESNKRKTIVFDNEKADISITRVLPSNILISESLKNNQISNEKTDVQNTTGIIKSTLIEDNLCDKFTNKTLSISDKLSSNTKLGDKNGTKHQYDMSESEMLSLNIANNVTESEAPRDLRNEIRLSTISDKFVTNMSITESVPNDILMAKNHLKTEIPNDVSSCDISLTQAVPINIILEQKEKIPPQVSIEEAPNRSKINESNCDLKSIRTSEKLSRKSLGQYARRTIEGNVLQAESEPTPIPSIVSSIEEKQQLDLTVSDDNVKDCLQQLAQVPSVKEFSRSYADMSMTQVLRANDILQKSTHSKRGTIVFDNDEMGDISVTQAVPAVLLNEIKSRDNTLLIFQNVNSNPLTSVSDSDGMLTKSEETVASKIIVSYTDIPVPKDTISNKNSSAPRTLQQAKEELERNRAETDYVDMSIDNVQHHDTRPHSERDETLLKCMNYMDCDDQKFETNSLKSTTDHKQDVFVYQAVTTHNVSKHQSSKTEQGDVKSEKTIDKDEENTSIKSNVGKEGEISIRHDMSQLTDDRKNTDFEFSKQNKKNSILAELLNMSGESLNMSVDGMDDKNVMVGLESQLALEKFAQDCCENYKRKIEQTKSIESRSEECNNTSGLNVDAIKPMSFSPEQKEVRSCLLQAENPHRPLSLSYEEETHPQNKENILCSNLETKTDKSIEVVESCNKFEDKYVKEADDTKELLEMLRDFTDKSMPGQPEADTNQSIKDILTTQEKTDVNDASDKKESLEKLQRNVSTSQPTLEAMEGVESEGHDSKETIYEETDDVMYKEVNLRRKSGHVSRDVVKTLQFDESNDEIKCTSNSPLRKTTPADISCAQDSKAKVIPTYLNDVSDGLKSLMQDLVKPTADLMPYETAGVDRINKKSTSTRNKELQTNIITSSQIDIIDINSYPVSESNIILSHRENRQEHFEDVASKVASVHCDISDTKTNAQNVAKNVVPKPVLVFDHKNPLNNVILCPTGKTDIHKYSPKTSPPPEYELEKNITKTSSHISHLEEKFKEAMEIQRVSTLYNINTSDARSDKKLNSSIRETLQEPCDDVNNKTHLKLNTENDRNPITSTQVNTLIAMKCNKELLQANSSLTVVEDEEDIVIKNKTPVKSTNMRKTSPVKVIFKLNEQEDENVESSVDLSDADCTKAKKRNYNRAKYDHYKVSSPDVTPKPLSKMQKLSSSPRRVVENFRSESDKSFNKSTKDESIKRCPKPSAPNNIKQKLRMSTVVQHVTTLCKLNTEVKEKPLDLHDDMESSSGSTLKTETISHKDLKECTSTELTSFTSSNAMKEMEYMPSLVTVSGSQEAAGARSETTSDCDDSSVLMSEIEALSFMGSRECEWESCEADAWRFLLLRRRLRLTVRAQRDVTELAHAPHMRPDTPLISISIEPVHQESDAIACASLRLACEAMRYECVRCGAGEGAGASSVGALLRRCVGVARAATRWARLMVDARAHLAFTLVQCGRIQLTVANFHLRRVWDVTIRIELVVEDARELAWPRASHVAVRDVTLGSAGGEGGARGHRAPDVRRVLARVPHDWGHVPRTIWKVFRHLKNKTEEDELFWPLLSR